MPRRSLDRKKAPALDERTAARYLLELPGDRLYREPLAFPRISSASLFRNERPMELEIGCGNGEFLCSLARRDHETNFVGVEVKRKSVLEAVARASSADLDNIIFLRANFRLLYPLLTPGSLGAVYLHFPDPNTRARFRKHRIFSDRFLREMHTATTSDGRISVMTDHEGSFTEMLRLAEGDERWEKNHAQRYLVGFETENRSRFQRIWEGHGLPTLRFELVKRGPEVGDVGAKRMSQSRVDGWSRTTSTRDDASRAEQIKKDQ
jgi:tRNA (guanine-N7-)-methyltransferase